MTRAKSGPRAPAQSCSLPGDLCAAPTHSRRSLGGLILLLLLGMCVAGCGASRVPPRAHFQAKNQTSLTVGLMRVHFADEIGAADRRLAEEAIRAHFDALNRLHFAVVFHLNQSWPTRTIDVYVHGGVTLGSPFMAPVEGRLAADGSVHVVIGTCATVPSLTRWASHAWWHPLEDETVVPLFWVEVLREQADTVKWVRIQRGCR